MVAWRSCTWTLPSAMLSALAALLVLSLARRATSPAPDSRAAAVLWRAFGLALMLVASWWSPIFSESNETRKGCRKPGNSQKPRRLPRGLSRALRSTGTRTLRAWAREPAPDAPSKP